MQLGFSVRVLIEVYILNYGGPREMWSKDVVSGDGFHYWDGRGIQGMDFHHLWVRWIDDKSHQELIGVFRIEIINMLDKIQYMV